MSDRARSSRSRVGTSREALEMDISPQARTATTRPTVRKKNSWTNLATKARRLSKKRQTSSRNKQESDDSPPKILQSEEKGLEDYTAWCNHYLIRGLHREIAPDLRTAVGDGTTLINFVESLTKKSIPDVCRQPVTWSQKLDNINVCFQFLNSEGVRTTGIFPEDVIEGKLKSILRLFQCLERHFEVRYSRERQRHDSKTEYRQNGRMSSGYHSEDDAYKNGRTTPTIEALPGLLASDTNTDTDNDSFDPVLLRLHFVDNPSVVGAKTIVHHGQGQPTVRNTERSLDNIGYLPSHPSRKTRQTGQLNYEKNLDRRSSLENHPAFYRTDVSTSHVQIETSDRAVFLNSENDGHARDNYGLEITASDFGIDDSTSVERGSLSSSGTPVLPDLSSASSFEDLPLDFSSDASGLYPRESFRASSKMAPDSAMNTARFSADSVQKQIDALHTMYEKLLSLIDKDAPESRRKTKFSLPRVTMLQAKGKSSAKQRTKDMKSLNRRFNRIEGNIVTLARSVDHLRTEIRSQADTGRQLAELRAEVNEFKGSVYSNSFRKQCSQRSRDYDQRLRRLQKLKSFFGEEPPMVALLLQKLGYDRFIPSFKAEEIGILELPYMTEQRLQNLGIPLGPRLRILEEIQSLR